MCHCNTDLSFCKFCILFYQNDVIYLSVYIQLLTKVSTLPHDEPLDFMLNDHFVNFVFCFIRMMLYIYLYIYSC